jgi:hypothetical protein
MCEFDWKYTIPAVHYAYANYTLRFIFITGTVGILDSFVF